MNERIEQLAQEAADSTRAAHNNAYWRMMDEMPEDKVWREKFALLIVRECAEQVEQAKNSPFVSLDDAKRMKHFVDVTKKKIKQHFGVK